MIKSQYRADQLLYDILPLAELTKLKVLCIGTYFENPRQITPVLFI